MYGCREKKILQFFASKNTLNAYKNRIFEGYKKPQ